MKRTAIIILCIVPLILACSILSARSGPDNALGIDPLRVEEIVRLVEPISEKWSRRFGRSLYATSIAHRFPVGEVRPGPIPGEVRRDGEVSYDDYVDIGGIGRSSQRADETGEWVRVFELLVENPVLEVIKPAARSRSDLTLTETHQGVTIDEIVRITYDFVLFFDNDIGDKTSYRIVMPMDVTLFGEAGWRPREIDGCAGWRSEYRLLEVSYGPLEMITVRAE